MKYLSLRRCNTPSPMREGWDEGFKYKIIEFGKLLAASTPA
jgi:hypothetical protein